MSNAVIIRDIARTDYDQWLPLWDGYNEFYERVGPTALPRAITDTTWARFFDPSEPVFAMVAERDGALIGLVHYLFHRSTTLLAPICYLQDLFASHTPRAAQVSGARAHRSRLRARRGIGFRARLLANARNKQNCATPLRPHRHPLGLYRLSSQSLNRHSAWVQSRPSDCDSVLAGVSMLYVRLRFMLGR